MKTKPTNEQVWELLEHLASAAPPVLREHFAVSSCIGSTGVILRVLREIGVKAVPFATKVMILNKPLVERINRDGWPKGDEIIEWTSDGSGAWSVGIGYGAPNMVSTDPFGRPGYDGHLVALVNDAFLFDATISQASRPQYNIDLPPVMMSGVSRGFAKGKEKFMIESTEGECRVIYTPIRDDSFRAAPDWINKDRHERPSIKILASLGYFGL